ncbi:unnamed protein product [Callosobruchus maculatus]|uniref:Uncharacterized protein n=1 Tax=Callosobruchus maculatus TaxID=64391 RepID=A0A653CPI4_CALMS|nr:unnamed protein product [Callosobruchus maculatus]
MSPVSSTERTSKGPAAKIKKLKYHFHPKEIIPQDEIGAKK